MIAILEILHSFFKIYTKVLSGWIQLLISSSKRFLSEFSQFPASYQFLIILNGIQFTLSFTSWISYQIVFDSKPETFSMRIEYSVPIIILTFIIGILHFLKANKLISFVKFLIQSFLGSLLAVGCIIPKRIYANFILETDYYLNWKFYLFLFVWSVNFIALLKSYLDEPSKRKK